MNPGLYLHIPFCEQRCYYCAFTVAVAPEHTFEPYVDRLVREMALSGFDRDPGTVYFGGGTPSLVNAELIGRILRTLRSVPDEVSIEVNPGTLSESKVQQYRALRISRISLGAQSLEDEDLARAGRLHKAAAVFSDFEMLRREGFTNINLDLIAGLPGQQLQTWKRNLERVLDLRPEHISIYMLDQEERSAWARLPAGVPEESDFAAFYSLAEEKLDAEGYSHYEISNWALPGRECAHNIGYWSGFPIEDLESVRIPLTGLAVFGTRIAGGLRGERGRRQSSGRGGRSIDARPSNRGGVHAGPAPVRGSGRPADCPALRADFRAGVVCACASTGRGGLDPVE